MAVRDPHYLKLVQRERLAEAALEREASVAARAGWTPDPGPIEEPEPSLGRDIFRSVIHAVVSAAYSVGLIFQEGWLRWIGAACLVLVTAMVVASVRRIGRRLVDRRAAR